MKNKKKNQENKEKQHAIILSRVETEERILFYRNKMCFHDNVECFAVG
jgi:hypothetical protein